MTLERWQTFSEREQLAHIASEIFRAKLANDQNIRDSVIERAMDLIDLTLQDPKWRNNFLMLLCLRSELAKIYLNKSQSLEEVMKAF